MAALALTGTMAKLFFQHLNIKHKPPQNSVFMRMVRLLDQAFFREFRRLIQDNILWLGSDFASTNSDFYQCPERREAYGCIVANMCAKKYHLNDGRQLFISQQTLNEGLNKSLLLEDGGLSCLEAVISFKKFDGAKTGHGIGTWMMNEHTTKGLLPSYVGYHSTDGASNAVASANHYELLTEMNRDSAIHHDKCMAHQNNRSAKFASGTGDFRVCSNPTLRVVLNKTHNIVARIHRAPHRLKVVREVQKAANCKSIVIPLPSVVTQWDSSNIEVASVNRIMGDLNNALTLLIEGTDEELLTRDGQNLSTSDFTFTEEDKTILRQFECGSEPCLLLSKFFQLNKPTCHETLFVITARLAQIGETSFMMYADKSHTNLPDLSNRDRTVNVYGCDHVHAGMYNGVNEEEMEPCIELFRELYAKDMAFRCGLVDEEGDAVDHLPTIIGMSCLMNPMYGGETNIVKSGLMTQTQYKNAYEDLMRRMTSMREREVGHVILLDNNSSDEDSACLDDRDVMSDNTERANAIEEFRVFCNSCKKEKNRPKAFADGSLKLGPCDMRKPIVMGKVTMKGEDIKATPPFKHCNLVTYIDDKGHFDLLAFFHYQQDAFPTLYKLAVCLASIRTNEVGCERFFSTAGYVSCPRRTRLNVRNYECLAMLKSNMKQVYIDEGWVVDQYMRMEKAKSWKELDSADDLRVLNLERELLAESLGMDMEDLENDNEIDEIQEDPEQVTHDLTQ